MEGAEHPELVALRRVRDATLEQLSECFARDQLSLDEFERRVDRAYASSEETSLRALVADLAPPAPAALARSAPAELVVAGPAEHESSRLALAVFGSVERAASGHLASGRTVLSVFGNVELDLRDAHFPAGVTELRVRAVFGNIEITVPPTLAVECRGAPIFGSFASLDRVAREGGGEATLRIVGSAIFGNVEVKTLPRRALLEAGARRRGA